MKFAICNELFNEQSLLSGFLQARNFGYTGIEIAPFTLGTSPGTLSKQQRADVRSDAKRADLEIVGLHWLLAQTEGFHLTAGDATVRSKTADYLGKLADLCADLGGKVMVLGSPQQRQLAPETSRHIGVERAKEVLEKLLPTLERADVTLALEPLGPEEVNFLNTAEEAIDLIRALDSPYVRLHLDVKAMSTEPRSMTEIITSCRQWLVHFHANDPNRQGPGMGEVDFVPIAAVLKQIQYDRWISVEVFDYSPGIDRLAGESIQYLRQVFEV